MFCPLLFLVSISKESRKESKKDSRGTRVSISVIPADSDTSDAAAKFSEGYVDDI